jgi:hypothetical protein
MPRRTASEDDEYFEGQRSKDCVIHSFNNAFGAPVISKAEVLTHINRKVTDFIAQLEEDPNMSPRDISGREKEMRARYSSGKTFFSADIVWDCARHKGLYKVHAPIPGFTTPFLRMDAMTAEVVAHPIVLLGGDDNGDTHAVAVRRGMIYDSERVDEGPRPLTKREVKESLPKVFGAYAFLGDARDVSAIRRSLNIVKSFD